MTFVLVFYYIVSRTFHEIYSDRIGVIFKVGATLKFGQLLSDYMFHNVSQIQFGQCWSELAKKTAHGRFLERLF